MAFVTKGKFIVTRVIGEGDADFYQKHAEVGLVMRLGNGRFRTAVRDGYISQVQTTPEIVYRVTGYSVKSLIFYRVDINRNKQGKMRKQSVLFIG